MITARLLPILALVAALVATAIAPAAAGARPTPTHAHHAKVKAKHKHHQPKRHKKVKHTKKPTKHPKKGRPAAPVAPPAVGAPAPAPAPSPAAPAPAAVGGFAGADVDEEPAAEGYGGLPYVEGNCTRYAWTRRQDLPATLGNATTWDERAADAGFPVDGTPRVGDVGVMEAGTHDTGRYGHVFYVERVVGDGTIVISDMNWVGLGVVSQRTISAAGIHFIHRKGAASQPPQPAPPQTFTHHVVGTCAEGACGLRKRTGPGYSAYAVVGTVYDGQEIAIACQTMGEAVAGANATSAVWDRLADGSYVSDYYTDTPAVGTWSAPIPRC
jgi:surface antigen